MHACAEAGKKASLALRNLSLCGAVARALEKNLHYASIWGSPPRPGSCKAAQLQTNGRTEAPDDNKDPCGPGSADLLGVSGPNREEGTLEDKAGGLGHTMARLNSAGLPLGAATRCALESAHKAERLVWPWHRQHPSGWDHIKAGHA